MSIRFKEMLFFFNYYLKTAVFVKILLKFKSHLLFLVKEVKNRGHKWYIF